MTWHPDRFQETGLAARADSIRETAKRFDEATLAAAESIRDAEIRYVEGELPDAEAEAIFDAASAAVPHAAGLVTLLSILNDLPAILQNALPALVNDTNITRITDVLGYIDKELNSYFADSDSVHLTDALDTGRQNLYQALRRSFGYWQPGRASETVVADLDLRPERRHKLASKLLASLQDWIPGSRTQLRGSLGSGTADNYSDIDIRWIVPDAGFGEAVDTAGAALSRVTAVLSFRTDPEVARSARRRLVFARLYGVPLFWRVDIDIRADSVSLFHPPLDCPRTLGLRSTDEKGSVATDDHYDLGHPDAFSDTGWSAPASAIENAIAAIKAAARGQADIADALLRRGGQRIGHDLGPTSDLADAITSLADVCATQEPGLADMAAEVRQVADHLLRPDRPA
jgi:hypothetical protein